MGMVIAVLAIGPNGEFGNDNPEFKGLPFASKADMGWFARLTSRQNVLMSRKTLALIGGGLLNLSNHGLQGRNVLLATREGILQTNAGVEDKTQPVDLTAFHNDVFICGGGRVYLDYIDRTDLVFVSIVKKLRDVGDKTNSVTTFSIEPYFKAGFKTIYSGSNIEYSTGDVNNLLVLSKRQKQVTDESAYHQPPRRVKNLINEWFEPYLKLRVKDRIEIFPNSHAEVFIDTFVIVPLFQTGIFSIRKALARQGLYTSAIAYKSKWWGRPSIIVTNSSLSTVELKAGDEIGEISFVNNNVFK